MGDLWPLPPGFADQISTPSWVSLLQSMSWLAVRVLSSVTRALASSLEPMIIAEGWPSPTRRTNATWVPSQARTSFAKLIPVSLSAASIPLSIWAFSC